MKIGYVKYSGIWLIAVDLHLGIWGVPPPELKVFVENGFIKPCKAVDIGCGTGTSTIYLAEKGFTAYGIDISGEAIKKAWRKAGHKSVRCRFYIADITDVERIRNLGLNGFKLALDVGCLHTILTENARRLYRKSLDQLLEVGGYLLL